jgi:hypothetical protein
LSAPLTTPGAQTDPKPTDRPPANGRNVTRPLWMSIREIVP